MSHLTPPKTRAQMLAEHLEFTISQRGLTPGDSLGTIDSWREETGYGRGTVSEAIRIMAERGTIEVRPGRTGGLFVAASDPVIGLRRTLLAVHDQAATIDDAIALRAALEPIVYGDAAANGSADDHAEIELALVAAERAAGDADGFPRLYFAVLERVAQVTANTLVKVVYIATSTLIREVQSRSSAGSSTSVAGRRADLARLRVLVDAIAAGDADAAAAWRAADADPRA